MKERLAPVLEAQPDVLVAYLFGSRARETARDGSDVDVAVLLDGSSDPGRRQLELMADLQAVAAPARVDLVMLDEAPPSVAYRVLRDGVVLVCRDEAARVRHFVRTVDRYLDMAPMRRVIEEGQRKRLERGRFGRS